MKTIPKEYYTPRQGHIPVFLSEFLSVSDPVLAFDRFMEGIELSKYLKGIPKHCTGRNRYNPVDMLKTVLFAFADKGYCSLRELEDNCKVNIRYMYLMNWKTPSYRTFFWFAEKASRVLEAEINGVCLGVEPEVNNIICSPEKAREYLDAVGSERLRIVMDGANLFRVEQLAKMRETLQEAFVLLGRDIVLAHAKDITYKKGMEFVAPGKGVLDYKTYFALLKQYSYKGPVIMHGLSEQQVPQSAQFLQRFMDTA